MLVFLRARMCLCVCVGEGVCVCVCVCIFVEKTILSASMVGTFSCFHSAPIFIALLRISFYYDNENFSLFP